MARKFATTAPERPRAEEPGQQFAGQGRFVWRCPCAPSLRRGASRALGETTSGPSEEHFYGGHALTLHPIPFGGQEARPNHGQAQVQQSEAGRQCPYPGNCPANRLGRNRFGHNFRFGSIRFGKVAGRIGTFTNPAGPRFAADADSTTSTGDVSRHRSSLCQTGSVQVRRDSRPARKIQGDVSTP
jgi:hypothetical protein